MKSDRPVGWVYASFIGGYLQYFLRVLQSDEPILKRWMTHLLMFVGYSIVAILVDLLVREVRRQRRSQESSILAQQSSAPTPPLQEIPESFDYLVKLVGGDQETAYRLVQLASENHPGKSLEWWCEKAVDDLIRDRERG